MTFALVDPAGRVCDIAAAPFDVHSALTWVAVPSGVSVSAGYSASRDGNGNWLFVAPVAPARNLALDARIALDVSDTTIIRCAEHGVTVPDEWRAYRAALRAIASGADTTSTALPARPSFPAGT